MCANISIVYLFNYLFLWTLYNFYPLFSEVDAIRSDQQAAADDVDGYLSNPVNAYRLIKRLQSDWNTFEDVIRADTSRAGMYNIYQVYLYEISVFS